MDEATLRIAERMLRAPPKPHDEMKVGRRKKAKRSKAKSKERLATAPRPDPTGLMHYARGFRVGPDKPAMLANVGIALLIPDEQRGRILAIMQPETEFFGRL